MFVPSHSSPEGSLSLASVQGQPQGGSAVDAIASGSATATALPAPIAVHEEANGIPEDVPLLDEFNDQPLISPYSTTTVDRYAAPAEDLMQTQVQTQIQTPDVQQEQEHQQQSKEDSHPPQAHDQALGPATTFGTLSSPTPDEQAIPGLQADHRQQPVTQTPAGPDVHRSDGAGSTTADTGSQSPQALAQTPEEVKVGLLPQQSQASGQDSATAALVQELERLKALRAQEDAERARLEKEIISAREESMRSARELDALKRALADATARRNEERKVQSELAKLVEVYQSSIQQESARSRELAVQLKELTRLRENLRNQSMASAHALNATAAALDTSLTAQSTVSAFDGRSLAIRAGPIGVSPIIKPAAEPDTGRTTQGLDVLRSAVVKVPSVDLAGLGEGNDQHSARNADPAATSARLRLLKSKVLSARGRTPRPMEPSGGAVVATTDRAKMSPPSPQRQLELPSTTITPFPAQDPSTLRSRQDLPPAPVPTTQSLVAYMREQQRVGLLPEIGIQKSAQSNQQQPSGPVGDIIMRTVAEGAELFRRVYEQSRAKAVAASATTPGVVTVPAKPPPPAIPPLNLASITNQPEAQGVKQVAGEDQPKGSMPSQSGNRQELGAGPIDDSHSSRSVDRSGGTSQELGSLRDTPLSAATNEEQLERIHTARLSVEREAQMRLQRELELERETQKRIALEIAIQKAKRRELALERQAQAERYRLAKAKEAAELAQSLGKAGFFGVTTTEQRGDMSASSSTDAVSSASAEKSPTSVLEEVWKSHLFSRIKQSSTTGAHTAQSKPTGDGSNDAPIIGYDTALPQPASKLISSPQKLDVIPADVSKHQSPSQPLLSIRPPQPPAPAIPEIPAPYASPPRAYSPKPGQTQDQSLTIPPDMVVQANVKQQQSVGSPQQRPADQPRVAFSPFIVQPPHMSPTQPAQRQLESASAVSNQSPLAHAPKERLMNLEDSAVHLGMSFLYSSGSPAKLSAEATPSQPHGSNKDVQTVADPNTGAGLESGGLNGSDLSVSAELAPKGTPSKAGTLSIASESSNSSEEAERDFMAQKRAAATAGDSSTSSPSSDGRDDHYGSTDFDDIPTATEVPAPSIVETGSLKALRSITNPAAEPNSLLSTPLVPQGASVAVDPMDITSESPQKVEGITPKPKAVAPLDRPDQPTVASTSSPQTRREQTPSAAHGVVETSVIQALEQPRLIDQFYMIGTGPVTWPPPPEAFLPGDDRYIPSPAEVLKFVAADSFQRGVDSNDVEQQLLRENLAHAYVPASYLAAMRELPQLPQWLREPPPPIRWQMPPSILLKFPATSQAEISEQDILSFSCPRNIPVITHPPEVIHNPEASDHLDYEDAAQYKEYSEALADLGEVRTDPACPRLLGPLRSILSSDVALHQLGMIEGLTFAEQDAESTASAAAPKLVTSTGGYVSAAAANATAAALSASANALAEHLMTTYSHQHHFPTTHFGVRRGHGCHAFVIRSNKNTRTLERGLDSMDSSAAQILELKQQQGQLKKEDLEALQQQMITELQSKQVSKGLDNALYGMVITVAEEVALVHTDTAAEIIGRMRVVHQQRLQKLEPERKRDLEAASGDAAKSVRLPATPTAPTCAQTYRSYVLTSRYPFFPLLFASLQVILAHLAEAEATRALVNLQKAQHSEFVARVSSIARDALQYRQAVQQAALARSAALLQPGMYGQLTEPAFDLPPAPPTLAPFQAKLKQGYNGLTQLKLPRPRALTQISALSQRPLSPHEVPACVAFLKTLLKAGVPSLDHQVVLPLPPPASSSRLVANTAFSQMLEHADRQFQQALLLHWQQFTANRQYAGPGNIQVATATTHPFDSLLAALNALVECLPKQTDLEVTPPTMLVTTSPLHTQPTGSAVPNTSPAVHWYADVLSTFASLHCSLIPHQSDSSTAALVLRRPRDTTLESYVLRPSSVTTLAVPSSPEPGSADANASQDKPSSGFSLRNLFSRNKAQSTRNLSSKDEPTKQAPIVQRLPPLVWSRVLERATERVRKSQLRSVYEILEKAGPSAFDLEPQHYASDFSYLTEWSWGLALSATGASDVPGASPARPAVVAGSLVHWLRLLNLTQQALTAGTPHAGSRLQLTHVEQQVKSPASSTLIAIDAGAEPPTPMSAMVTTPRPDDQYNYANRPSKDNPPPSPRESLFERAGAQGPSSITPQSMPLAAMLRYPAKVHLPMEAETLVSLLEFLLLEYKVIVVDTSVATLSACTLFLLSLIRPLEWAGTFIPLLPPQLEEVINSPVPLITGMQVLPASFQTPVDLPADTVIWFPSFNHTIWVNPEHTTNLGGQAKGIKPSLPFRKHLVVELSLQLNNLHRLMKDAAAWSFGLDVPRLSVNLPTPRLSSAQIACLRDVILAQQASQRTAAVATAALNLNVEEAVTLGPKTRADLAAPHFPATDVYPDFFTQDAQIAVAAAQHALQAHNKHKSRTWLSKLFSSAGNAANSSQALRVTHVVPLEIQASVPFAPATLPAIPDFVPHGYPQTMERREAVLKRLQAGADYLPMLPQFVPTKKQLAVIREIQSLIKGYIISLAFFCARELVLAARVIHEEAASFLASPSSEDAKTIPKVVPQQPYLGTISLPKGWATQSKSGASEQDEEAKVEYLKNALSSIDRDRLAAAELVLPSLTLVVKGISDSKRGSAHGYVPGHSEQLYRPVVADFNARLGSVLDTKWPYDITAEAKKFSEAELAFLSNFQHQSQILGSYLSQCADNVARREAREVDILRAADTAEADYLASIEAERLAREEALRRQWLEETMRATYRDKPDATSLEMSPYRGVGGLAMLASSSGLASSSSITPFDQMPSLVSQASVPMSMDATPSYFRSSPPAVAQGPYGSPAHPLPTSMLAPQQFLFPRADSSYSNLPPTSQGMYSSSTNPNPIQSTPMAVTSNFSPYGGGVRGPSWNTHAPGTPYSGTYGGGQPWM